jgi:pilus assembly protein CpaF
VIPQKVFEYALNEFFAPVRPFLQDSAVTEIMINGPGEVFVERQGQLTKTDVSFESKDELLAALRNLGQYVGRPVDESRPILEGRLPDGSRVEAILPPIAPDGPTVAIRRFFRETLTIERLIGFDSLTKEAAACLEALVGVKQNVVVAGGTGSGKTSMLNALSSFIGADERIVVIEDNRELQLQMAHVVQLEARPPDGRDRRAVTIRDLCRASLRLRPDRIVVGEIRGGEALDLVQAMTSGHGGCMSTVHATYPTDTMMRLETMALMSDVGLPLHALRTQVASAIDIVVQTARLKNGSRCVTHISEVLGYDPEAGYNLQDLFLRHYHGMSPDGKIRTELRATGKLPRCYEMIQALGYALPHSMYDKGGDR